LGTALIGAATGYSAVYSLEIVLLVATLCAMVPLISKATGPWSPPVPAAVPLGTRDPLDTLVDFYLNR
jgi:hypothetical protein